MSEPVLTQDISTIKKLIRNPAVKAFLIGVLALGIHEITHLTHTEQYNSVIDQILSAEE